MALLWLHGAAATLAAGWGVGAVCQADQYRNSEATNLIKHSSLH